MKPRKLKINIPDGLTNEQEAKEISILLRQKLLASNGYQVDKKRIGNEVNIKYTKTEIVVERIGSKPIEMVECNVCGCEYQNDMFKRVYVNYGGKNKCIKVCSEICQDSLIDLCGVGRAAKKVKELIPVNLYYKR